MNTNQFLATLERRKQRHGTWKAYAVHLGVSLQQLRDVAQAKCAPNPKLLEAMGFERETVYKEVRAPRDHTPRFMDGTPDVGCVGLARMLTRKAKKETA